MKLLVRTHPIEVYYLTGEEARSARSIERGSKSTVIGSAPCFTTEACGADGLVWDTPQQFEADHAAVFGTVDTDQLIVRIAGRLSGIHEDDLTTAERQITKLLLASEHLITDDDGNLRDQAAIKPEM
jgi:hypothetical protein